MSILPQLWLLKHRHCLYGFAAIGAVVLNTHAISTAADVGRSDDRLVLSAESRIQSPDTLTLAFDLPNVKQGEQVRLGLDARLDWPGVNGSNPWFSVNLNGHPLSGPDLINKPLDFMMLDGVEASWVRGNLWRTLMSHDFSDRIKTTKYAHAVPWTDPFRFVWDVTRYAKAGGNTLMICHPALYAKPTTLVLRQIEVEHGVPIPSQAVHVVSPAPRGPLSTYMVDNPTADAGLKVSLGTEGSLTVTCDSRRFRFDSRTSEPDGRWAVAKDGARRFELSAGGNGEGRWRGTGYEVLCKVTVYRDHVHVADTISNTSDKLVGVRIHHTLPLAEAPDHLLLHGMPQYLPAQRTPNPHHPTVTARWKGLVIGLAAEDDIFREQALCCADASGIGLWDDQLGIAPGRSHTLEWSLYAIPGGDYWSFINAVRRDWGANEITIPNFTWTHQSKYPDSAESYGRWARDRGVKYFFAGGQAAFDKPLQLPDGRLMTPNLAEGTDILRASAWCDQMRTIIGKMAAAAPETQVILYLHPGICTEPDATTRYGDCRHLNENGSQATSVYKYPVFLYIPTLENSYGKALMRTAEYLYGGLGGGLWVDEMETFQTSVPRYVYHGQWDGCTVAIDPATHAVTKQYSNTALLTLPWKAELVRRMHARGKMIIGNSPHSSRTLLQLKVPRIRELSSFSFLVDSHLSTPWALANFYTAHTNKKRAQTLWRSLERGAVISAYDWADGVHAPDFYPLLFPITPVKLAPGMMLGRERIVTNRSGVYGWPDDSAADTYVFDAAGLFVPSPQVREIMDSGHRRYEVRMPGDHFAILVRKDAKAP
jgi:hypothetical protein